MVPDPDSLPSFADKIGVKGSFEELCQNQVSMGQNVLHINTAQNVFYANMTENVHYVSLKMFSTYESMTENVLP